MSSLIHPGASFQVRFRGAMPSLPPTSSPLPFLLFPSHFPLPCTSPPLRSRPLIIRLGSLGSTLAPPAGPGSAKLYLANLRLKISLLVATIFRSFSGNETPNWGGGGLGGRLVASILSVQTNSLDTTMAWKTFCKDVARVPPLPFPPFRSRPPCYV